MTGPNAADRERADGLIYFGAVADVDVDTLKGLVATALAEERARALQPVLELADRVREVAEFEQEAGRDAVALFQAVGWIRRAAGAPR